jgi:hypothetical protein
LFWIAVQPAGVVMLGVVPVTTTARSKLSPGWEAAPREGAMEVGLAAEDAATAGACRKVAAIVYKLPM